MEGFKVFCIVLLKDKSSQVIKVFFIFQLLQMLLFFQYCTSHILMNIITSNLMLTFHSFFICQELCWMRGLWISFKSSCFLFPVRGEGVKSCPFLPFYLPKTQKFGILKKC